MAPAGSIRYAQPPPAKLSSNNRCFCIFLCVLGLLFAVMLAIIAVMFVQRANETCSEPCLCWDVSTAPAGGPQQLTVDVTNAEECTIEKTVGTTLEWRHLCDSSFHLEYRWSGEFPMQVRCVGSPCTSGTLRTSLVHCVLALLPLVLTTARGSCRWHHVRGVAKRAI